MPLHMDLESSNSPNRYVNVHRVLEYANFGHKFRFGHLDLSSGPFICHTFVGTSISYCTIFSGSLYSILYHIVLFNVFHVLHYMIY
jgi:hypothetical protein